MDMKNILWIAVIVVVIYIGWTKYGLGQKLGLA